jgi:hypothetical protein
VIITEEMMAALPPAEVSDILLHGFADVKTQKFWSLKDGANFFNHSSDPNITTIKEEGDWNNKSFAIRDIEVGEEITESYVSYKSSDVPWVAKMMTIYCPERAKMENDNLYL